jgi:NADH dehydrogenase, FAD-containing subunit
MNVAVLGAGYAGLKVARRLEQELPAHISLTLINDSPTHLVQHELHRTIREPSVVDTIQVSLREVLDSVELIEATVTDVDPGTGVVKLDGDDAPEEFRYDFGAICLGAETAFFGMESVQEQAVPLKRLSHAGQIRDDVLALTESGGDVVVGGAGLSGIQVAGEIAALADERGATDQVSVRLLEMADEVAPGFAPEFQQAIRAELEGAGITVQTGTAVTGATDDSVQTDAGTLPCDRLVWTGGIQGATTMDGDRRTVRADLRLSDSTFVVGDAAKVVDADGEPVPASAASAIREAKTAATNIARLATADSGLEPRLDRYRADIPGWVVSVGNGAVAKLGPQVVSGGPAKAMKATIGAGHLAGVSALRQAAQLAEAELS